MASKVTKAQIVKRIREASKVISDKRDDLRMLVCDVEDICNDADEAVDELNLAIEYLSRNL